MSYIWQQPEGAASLPPPDNGGHEVGEDNPWFIPLPSALSRAYEAATHRQPPEPQNIDGTPSLEEVVVDLDPDVMRAPQRAPSWVLASQPREEEGEYAEQDAALDAMLAAAAAQPKLSTLNDDITPGEPSVAHVVDDAMNTPGAWVWFCSRAPRVVAAGHLGAVLKDFEAHPLTAAVHDITTSLLRDAYKSMRRDAFKDMLRPRTPDITHIASMGDVDVLTRHPRSAQGGGYWPRATPFLLGYMQICLVFADVLEYASADKQAAWRHVMEVIYRLVLAVPGTLFAAASTPERVERFAHWFGGGGVASSAAEYTADFESELMQRFRNFGQGAAAASAEPAAAAASASASAAAAAAPAAAAAAAAANADAIRERRRAKRRQATQTAKAKRQRPPEPAAAAAAASSGATPWMGRMSLRQEETLMMQQRAEEEAVAAADQRRNDIVRDAEAAVAEARRKAAAAVAEAEYAVVDEHEEAVREFQRNQLAQQAIEAHVIWD